MAETNVTGADEVEPPWWRRPKGGTRRRPALSRDAIVDAAVRILDAEGVDALTVRRLADELGTGSATLYWHIQGKRELGELVYDRLMGEVDLPEPDPSRWEEQVKDLVRRMYRVMLRHNDAVRLSLGRMPVGPNGLRVMEWSLDLLRRIGVPDEQAAYFGDLVGRYIDASVLDVTAAHTDDELAAIGQWFGSLPVDRYPHVVAAVSSMFTGGDDDRFEFGLDVLVRGLAAYVPAKPPRRRRSGRP